MAAKLAFDIIANDRASKVFDQVGAKSAKTERDLSRLGSGSSMALGKITAGIAGAVGGFQAFDKVLVAGFNRLANIDDARKRLDQMGVSTAQAEKLMEGLTETVTGTAFSLDAGAGAMTGFVSAGVDLDEVNKRLEMTADTAAFAQAPLDEIGNIFVKIQTQGKLTAEELNMLQERGVPALLLLADAAGVTAEQMRDMISKGQVDAERFFALWETGAQGFGENNIKISGAAKSMGDTIRGSLANAETALARVGAEILERAVPAMIALADGTKAAADRIVDAGNALDDFNAKAEETVEKVAGQELDKGFFNETALNTATLGLYGVVTSLKDLVTGAEDATGATDEFVGGVSRFNGVQGELAAGVGAAAAALGEQASQAQLANEHLSAYADTLQRATDPVFALNSAIQDVDAAQAAYDATLADSAATQADAEAAAFTLAAAVSKAEQAAINGDLSFAEFEAKLADWVSQNVISQAAADTLRGKVATLRGEAEDFAGTYKATLDLKTRGMETWQRAQAFLNSIKSKTVTITAVTQLPPGVTVRQISEGRQHGGPVTAGNPYVVGERGPELFVPDRPGLIVSNKDSKAMAARGGAAAGGMNAREWADQFVRALRQAGLVMPRVDVARRADLIGRGG